MSDGRFRWIGGYLCGALTMAAVYEGRMFSFLTGTAIVMLFVDYLLHRKERA